MAKKLKDVNKDGKVNFKDTWLGERLSTKGKLKGPNLAESLKGARRGSDTSATESKPASKAASKSAAPTTSIRPKSKPADSGSRVGAKDRKVQTTAELRKAAEAKKTTTTTPTVDKEAQRTALKSVGPIGGLVSRLQVRPSASPGTTDRKITKDTARPSFDVNYDQWLKMTPEKRKELGLPATYGAVQRMLGTKMKTQTKNRFKFYNKED
jgi:hypothetical protein